MNIILIEDTNEKAKAIAQLLNEINSNINIDLCQNANDAKKLLQNKEYDIAILDLFIPKFLGQDPNPDGGYTLLTEILDSGYYTRPKKIICLTEHKNIFNDYKDIIIDELVTVHQFSYQNDKWKDILKKEVERTELTPRVIPKSYDSDFLVICALKDPELQALLDLRYEWNDPELFENTSIIHSGIINIHEKKFSINATYQDRMGSINTAIITTKLINKFRPKYVIMIGICAGDKSCTKFGDIILANPTINCDSGKWQIINKERVFSHDPHHIPTTTKLKGLIDLLSNKKIDIFNIHENYRADKPDNIPTIKIGSIACGSSVISDGSLYEEIKEKQGRKILGLDMESYGLYAACDLAYDPKPEYCCIKSVSDFADENKENRYQKYAAYTSANIFDLLIKKFHNRL